MDVPLHSHTGKEKHVWIVLESFKSHHRGSRNGWSEVETSSRPFFQGSAYLWVLVSKFLLPHDIVSHKDATASRTCSVAKV